MRFTDPPLQPLYNPLPETLNKIVGDNISVTAKANKTSTLKLYLNGNATPVQTVNNDTIISANTNLTSAGNTTIVAEANDGTYYENRYTLTFFVNAGVVIAPLPNGVQRWN